MSWSLILFMERDGRAPILDWLEKIPPKARLKCRHRLGRLKELGGELRRPEADYLRDGVYELRVGLHGINYRILYFFYGRSTVVVSHGIVKERMVPPREIEVAIARRLAFERDPGGHTYREWV